MDSIKDIISKCLELKSVIAYFDTEIENDCIALELIFNNCFFKIMVQDDDSLICQLDLNRYQHNSCKAFELGSELPWSECIGKPVRWFWTMENNLGYIDGVQFEFASNIEDDGTSIQLVAIASRIDSRLVTTNQYRD